MDPSSFKERSLSRELPLDGMKNSWETFRPGPHWAVRQIQSALAEQTTALQTTSLQTLWLSQFPTESLMDPPHPDLLQSVSGRPTPVSPRLKDSPVMPGSVADFFSAVRSSLICSPPCTRRSMAECATSSPCCPGRLETGLWLNGSANQAALPPSRLLRLRCAKPLIICPLLMALPGD